MKFGSANISAIKFGSSGVSAVYFGPTLVWSSAPQPRTLYFLGYQYAPDWGDVNNWFLDSIGQNYAESFPTPIDDVVALGLVNTESMIPTPTVANFSISGEFVNGDGVTEGNRLEGSLTVTGLATFSGITRNTGVINGSAIFNGSSANYGTVQGAATFNDTSQHTAFGYIDGTATFNDGSANNGPVAGEATFYDSSSNNGYLGGSGYFYDASSMTCNAAAPSGISWYSSSPVPQHGCADESALNYAGATCDDGSCCYYGYSESDCIVCEVAYYAEYDTCGNQIFYTDYYEPACGHLC